MARNSLNSHNKGGFELKSFLKDISTKCHEWSENFAYSIKAKPYEKSQWSSTRTIEIEGFIIK